VTLPRAPDLVADLIAYTLPYIHVLPSSPRPLGSLLRLTAQHCLGPRPLT